MLPPRIKSDRMESLDQPTQVWMMNTSMLDLIQRLHTRVAKLESRLTLGHPDHESDDIDDPTGGFHGDRPREWNVSSQGMRPVMTKFHDEIEYAIMTSEARLSAKISPRWDNYNGDYQSLWLYPNGTPGASIKLKVELSPDGYTLTLRNPLRKDEPLSTNNVRKAAACVIRLATGGGWSI